ncbi:hypothetical protein WJX79_004670 [Trebouxia sp. C0005]
MTIKTAIQDGRFVRYCSGSTEHSVVQQYVADYADTILQSVKTADLLFQTSNEAAAAWCYRVPEQLPVVDVVESLEDQSESDIGMITERVFNKGRSSCFQAHGPFIYIHWFGTVPSMQRQGYGGQVMKAITDIADAENKWTYLEASDQGYHLYIRHGFEVLEELRVTPDAPVMLVLLRTCRPKTTSQFAKAARHPHRTSTDVKRLRR